MALSVASTLDIALCRKETSATVAASLLSVLLSPCGCKYVSNMCLLKRVPLHRPRSRLEEDDVHGCCASSGMPVGSG